MMNDSKIVVTKKNNAVVTFRFNDFNAEDVFIDSGKDIKVGDIFIGRVSSVKNDIEAAFVNISDSVTGYLPFKEILPQSLIGRSYDGRLIQGDIVCVQVTKEPVRTKSFSLSMKLSISGRFSVVTFDDSKIHFSAKLSKLFVTGLKEKLNNIPFKYGFIVRTNSENVSFDLIFDEVEKNTKLLSDIESNMAFRTLYNKLYNAPLSYYERLKDLDTSSYSEIITDYEDIYENIKSLPNVRYYSDDKVLLKSLYSFDKAFSDATDRKVNLRFGGYLVIDHNEALTVFDVNSGKFDKKLSKEESAKIINMEAASEIARQLRLRNLSGIILVDFINMNKKSDMEEVISVLKEKLKKDVVTSTFVDVTKLGIVEITREKRYASIYDEIKNID